MAKRWKPPTERAATDPTSDRLTGLLKSWQNQVCGGMTRDGKELTMVSFYAGASAAMMLVERAPLDPEGGEAIIQGLMDDLNAFTKHVLRRAES